MNVWVGKEKGIDPFTFKSLALAVKLVHCVLEEGPFIPNCIVEKEEILTILKNEVEPSKLNRINWRREPNGQNTNSFSCCKS